MKLTETQVDSCLGLVLEDDTYRLLILPQVGGKLASLVHLPLDQEFIWRNPRRRFRLPRYGDLYERYDISGFDECFPNIGVGYYPEYPWQGIHLVDHGELWCSPWAWEMVEGALHLRTFGTHFPYRFDKWLRRSGGGIRIDYQVTNHAAYPFKCMWSAHPLFRAVPNMRILLPQSEGLRVRVDASMHGRLGPLCTEHSWPFTTDSQGQTVDLSLVKSPEARFGDKLYTTRLSEGLCALFDPASETYVGFTFSPDEVPYVGLWINQGAWPQDNEPCFNVALEPCTGYPDRLDIAIQREECRTIPAHGTLRWHLKLQAGRASDVFAALRD